MLVPVGARPARVYSRSWGPGCVANVDLVNPVYVGTEQGLSTESDQIPPLGALALDGSRDYFASTLAGPAVQLQSMPGTTSWTPSPAQVAAQISALGLARDTSVQGVNTTLALGTNPAITAQTAAGKTIAQDVAVNGVPLLNKKALLDSLTNFPIAHGTTHLTASLPITQPSYDFVIQLTVPAGTTKPYLAVVFSWSDSAIGVSTIVEETWYFPCGSAGTQSFGGHGITKGDTLGISFTNIDTAQTITVTYGISQTSRIVTRDDIRQIAYNTTNGQSPAPNDITANVLALWAPAINSGVTGTSVLMPLFSGKARLSLNEVTVASRVLIVAPAEVAAGAFGPITSGFIFDSGPLAANGVISAQEVTLPKSPCQLRIDNNGAANANYVASLIIEEY